MGQVDADAIADRLLRSLEQMQLDYDQTVAAVSQTTVGRREGLDADQASDDGESDEQDNDRNGYMAIGSDDGGGSVASDDEGVGAPDGSEPIDVEQEPRLPDVECTHDSKPAAKAAED